ncbi:MAG TPA: hypothetical protein VMU04_23180 [Candidatus Acidoferrum sp.]|nr:hypothetical protein [Candidatus Acidoferrum sp.]
MHWLTSRPDSPPDWQAKAAAEARRHTFGPGGPYPLTKTERLEWDYTPEDSSQSTRNARHPQRLWDK